MIVADASSLIALDRIRRTELLPRLYENTIIIPPAVAREVLRSPHSFQAGSPTWLIERPPADSAMVEALRRQRLGPGESEAIALAIELGSSLLIDEWSGRRVAKSMGVNIIGTAGVLLDAKRYSLIPSLSAALDELRAIGFRLSPHIVDELLKAAGGSKF